MPYAEKSLIALVDMSTADRIGHAKGEAMTTRRIGLIVPSSNTVMEVDFYRNLPPDVTLHTGRMFLQDTTVQGEEEMLDLHFPRALYDLASAKPDLIVFGCTSAGALRGNEYDEAMCGTIERVGGCMSVSVIRSVRDQLLSRKMDRVLVLTPYVQSLNERIRDSLEAQGTRVVAIHGLGIDHNHDIGMVTPGKILAFATEKADECTEPYDGLFLSCTNFRAMDVYKELERRTGKPVITSNQASLEAALAKLPAQ